MAAVRRVLRMIWCGLCRADHTPAELVACINSQAGQQR